MVIDEYNTGETPKENFTFVGTWRGVDKENKYVHEITISEYKDKNKLTNTTASVKISKLYQKELFATLNANIEYKENSAGETTVLIIKTTTKPTDALLELPEKPISYFLEVKDVKVLKGFVDFPNKNTNITLIKVK